MISIGPEPTKRKQRVALAVGFATMSEADRLIGGGVVGFPCCACATQMKDRAGWEVGEIFAEARSCNLIWPSPGFHWRGDSVPGLSVLYNAREGGHIPQMSYLSLAQMS